MRLATDVPLKLSVARGNILVGISGWSYAPWRGNFFPKGLPQKLELAYAARRFAALEVNGTFYSLQRPSTFTSWYNQTPPGFVFALKGGRFITHMRKLREPLASLANFFASGPLCLREKLGPILWQFPPQFHFNADRFRAFFDLLPRDTIEVARLARKYDDRIKGRVFLEADVCRPVRHAVEFRQRRISWSSHFLFRSLLDLPKPCAPAGLVEICVRLKLKLQPFRESLGFE